MMLKLGLVWMGEPVRMPVSLLSLCAKVQSLYKRTVFHQLSDKYTKLHCREEIDSPRHSSAQPALLLLFALSPSRLNAHAIVLRVIIETDRSVRGWLVLLVLQRYCILVGKRVWLSGIGVVEMCGGAVVGGRLVRGV